MFNSHRFNKNRFNTLVIKHPPVSIASVKSVKKVVKNRLFNYLTYVREIIGVKKNYAILSLNIKLQKLHKKESEINSVILGNKKKSLKSNGIFVKFNKYNSVTISKPIKNIYKNSLFLSNNIVSFKKNNLDKKLNVSNAKYFKKLDNKYDFNNIISNKKFYHKKIYGFVTKKLYKINNFRSIIKNNITINETMKLKKDYRKILFLLSDID